MAPTPYTVERSTVVAAPADQIFPLLVDFHEWPRWSPWEDIDPDMQRTYGGAESGVGATYAWSGNRKAGAGSMEITDLATPTALGHPAVVPQAVQGREPDRLRPAAGG